MEDLRRPNSRIIGLYRLDMPYRTYEDEFTDLHIQRWTDSVLEHIEKEDIPEEAWIFVHSFNMEEKEEVEKFFNHIEEYDYTYNEEVELLESLFKLGYYYDYTREFKYTADWV